MSTVKQFRKDEQKGPTTRINREIRVPQVRLIDAEGKQVGIVSRDEALSMAEDQGLDLVEVVPSAKPPVCKVIDYGKYRYDQARKEREQKKAQHQTKLKEVKVKPNISIHDFQFKAKNARSFLEKGHKVKLTCMFRGREMAHRDVGRAVVDRMIEALADVGTPETSFKQMGRMLTIVLAPGVKKKPTAKSPEEGNA